MTRERNEATLADIGEFRLLDRLIDEGLSSPDVLIGPGDDCAILRLGGRTYLWTTDSLTEGTHFERSWMTPRQIGAKAYLVNASDIAAMGGRPRFALVSLGAPANFPGRGLVDVQRGIVEMAARDRVAIVGGNLTRSPILQVTIALLGEAPRRPVLRSGAQPGDAIYVSGTLGDAGLGLRLLRNNPRARGLPVRRFRLPSPRVGAGVMLAARRIASAMIDVSDGLLADLRHICRASRVGARVDVEALPTSRAVRRVDPWLALHGGEDYELLCAVPARQEKNLESVAADLGCQMTRIGVFCDVREGVSLIGSGSDEAVAAAGFAHFSHQPRDCK